MAKYQDKTKCKHRPEMMHKKKGEHWNDRHERRLQKNKEHLDVLKNWCKVRNYEFRILNNGQHWQVKAFGKTFDWYPRTAKLVIDQQYKKGIHVQDYTQLIKILITHETEK